MKSIFRDFDRIIMRESDQVIIDAIRESRLPLSDLNQLFIDQDSTSILCCSFMWKKWQAAGYLYENGMRLTDKERARGNELVYVSGFLHEDNALALAGRLLPSINLAETEKRGGNTALSQVCLKVGTKQTYSEKTFSFLKKCFAIATDEAIYTQNKFGSSAWDVLQHFRAEDVSEIKAVIGSRQSNPSEV